MIVLLVWGLVGLGCGLVMARRRWGRRAPRYTEAQVLEAAFRSFGFGMAELARLRRALREQR